MTVDRAALAVVDDATEDRISCRTDEVAVDTACYPLAVGSNSRPGVVSDGSYAAAYFATRDATGVAASGASVAAYDAADAALSIASRPTQRRA